MDAIRDRGSVHQRDGLDALQRIGLEVVELAAQAVAGFEVLPAPPAHAVEVALDPLSLRQVDAVPHGGVGVDGGDQERLAHEELVADGEELGARALCVFANFSGFPWEPDVEQCERAVGVDEVLDDERRLVIRERDHAWIAEPFVQVGKLEQLVLAERLRERHVHLAAPFEPRAAFLEHRGSLAEPAWQPVVRHLQRDDVRHLVPQRRAPVEFTRRPRLRRVHRHDAAEARAQRAEHAGQAQRADREVVVAREHFDQQRPLRRELPALAERGERLSRQLRHVFPHHRRLFSGHPNHHVAGGDRLEGVELVQHLEQVVGHHVPGIDPERRLGFLADGGTELGRLGGDAQGRLHRIPSPSWVDHFGAEAIHVRQHLVWPRRIHDLPFDLVHFCSQTDAPAFGDVRAVVTVLDLIPHRMADLYARGKSRWRFRLGRWLERRALTKAKGIFTISDFTRHDLLDFLRIPPERIVVTPLAR